MCLIIINSLYEDLPLKRTNQTNDSDPRYIMEYHIGIMEYDQGHDVSVRPRLPHKTEKWFPSSHVQITYLFRQPYQEVSDPRYILNILDYNKRVSIIWSQPIHASLILGRNFGQETLLFSHCFSAWRGWMRMILQVRCWPIFILKWTKSGPSRPLVRWLMASCRRWEIFGINGEIDQQNMQVINKCDHSVTATWVGILWKNPCKCVCVCVWVLGDENFLVTMHHNIMWVNPHKPTWSLTNCNPNGFVTSINIMWVFSSLNSITMRLTIHWIHGKFNVEPNVLRPLKISQNHVLDSMLKCTVSSIQKK